MLLQNVLDFFSRLCFWRLLRRNFKFSYTFSHHHELVWQLRRGVIYGPISPIYGMGAVLMIAILGRKKRPDYQTIFYGALLGGGFEYLISFLQETFLGTVSWDYTNEFLNINGRTTIPYAFVWGLLLFYLLK